MLVFSAAGSHLASGSHDSSLRILDIAANREVARVTHGGPVLDARFGCDDNTRNLANANKANASVALWQSGDVRTEACRRVPYPLGDDVWRQYLGAAAPVGCAAGSKVAARE